MLVNDDEAKFLISGDFTAISNEKPGESNDAQNGKSESKY